MARGNFDSRVLGVRLDRKDRALQNALLVPWRELATRADQYVEWHAFLLWVRTIVDVADDVPHGIRSELRARCPGFLDTQQWAKDQPIWKLLEVWLATKCFAEAIAGEWFDAVMYYACKDVRTEQAWSLWKRAHEDWSRTQTTQ